MVGFGFGLPNVVKGMVCRILTTASCVVKSRPESANHLMARQLWYRLLAPVGLAALTPDGDDHLATWWLRQRKRVQGDARPPFDSLMLLVSWCTWKERNNRTFARSALGPPGLFRVVVTDAEDWVAAGFKTLAAACTLWSQITDIV